MLSGKRLLVLGTSVHVQLVHRANGSTAETDLDAVAAGLQHEGILFQGNNAAHDAADGGHLIADLDGVAHFRFLLLLLFLRTVHEKEHTAQDHQHKYERYDLEVFLGGCRKCNEGYGCNE